MARAEYLGAEVELRARVAPDTVLDADIQYLDATYKDFIYTVPNSNRGAGNGTGCPSSTVTTASYVVDCSGRTPPNAPKWTINLGADQTVHVGDGRIVLDARTHYQTKVLVGFEFTTVEYQKSYWTADVNLTYYSPSDRFSVGVFGTNLFDKTIKSAAFPGVTSTYTTATLRPPRVIGGRFGVNF